MQRDEFCLSLVALLAGRGAFSLWVRILAHPTSAKEPLTGFSCRPDPSAPAEARGGRRLEAAVLVEHSESVWASRLDKANQPGFEGPAGSLWLLSGLAAAPKAGVQHVAKSVAEKVEGEDQESNRQAGVDCQTGLGAHVLATLQAEHLAPGREWRR